MKGLFVLCAVVACGAAQYQPLVTPYLGHPLGYYAGAYQYTPYAAAPVPAYASSQYHSQDELGQFSYGYADPLSHKTETRTFDGTTVGSYSYIDANGERQTVAYTANDVDGFRVQATNLPQAPKAELKAAVFDGVAPEPVEETAEVKAARAEHARLFAEAAAAAEAAPDTDAEEEEQPAERRRRSLLIPALAKATVKTASLDPVEADTPADTTLLELKEKEHETYVHTAYAAPVAPVVTYSAPVVRHVSAPVTYTSAALPLTYGAFPYGLGTPLVYSVEPKTAEPAEEKAE